MQAFCGPTNYCEQLQIHVFGLLLDLAGSIALLWSFAGRARFNFLVPLSCAYGLFALSHALRISIASAARFSAISSDEAEKPANQCELFFSASSTIIFLYCAALIWRYPKQPFSTRCLTALLCFIGLLALVKGPGENPYFLQVIDTATAVAGVLCVGFGLIRVANNQRAAIAGWVAAAAYCLFSIEQLPYWLNNLAPEQHQYYFYSLSLSGLLAAFATVAFCSFALPDSGALRA